jgi:hypothetical protein
MVETFPGGPPPPLFQSLLSSRALLAPPIPELHSSARVPSIQPTFFRLLDPAGSIDTGLKRDLVLASRLNNRAATTLCG